MVGLPHIPQLPSSFNDKSDVTASLAGYLLGALGDRERLLEACALCAHPERLADGDAGAWEGERRELLATIAQHIRTLGGLDAGESGEMAVCVRLLGHLGGRATGCGALRFQ